MRSRFAWIVGLLGCAACAPLPPPFSRTPPAQAQGDPHQATLVFLWLPSSCDPGGYYTLVTADGRFVGNIEAGTQLRAQVPAGETTMVGWNQLLEDAGGKGTTGTVPLLHARLAGGRTYYVRMLFGEWDAGGPHQLVPGWPSSARRRCVVLHRDDGTTSAMVTLAPGSDDWRELPEWSAKLEIIAPDRAAGQAWVDARRDALLAHVAVGVDRYRELRPLARRMATVEEGDGVAMAK